MKVSSMANNQFLIHGIETYYVNGEPQERAFTVFQSYSTIIAKTYHTCGKRIVELDKNNWDYSKTTSKYRNRFLGETKKETQRKIDSGIYILTDLN